MSTNVTDWEDRLRYEPFCKAYLQELEHRHDLPRYYQKLVQTGPCSDVFNTKWFSLNSAHLTNLTTDQNLTQANSRTLENRMQQMLMRFDQQYNFTVEMVKNYETYGMQKRNSDLLLLRLMDQLETITDENLRIRLARKMTRLSDRAGIAERSQLWLRTIIKRHAQILRNTLEHYYVVRIIKQSLLALDGITDLHQDIIHQHQFSVFQWKNHQFS